MDDIYPAYTALKYIQGIGVVYRSTSLDPLPM